MKKFYAVNIDSVEVGIKRKVVEKLHKKIKFVCRNVAEKMDSLVNKNQ